MDWGGGGADCLSLQHHLRVELERPHTMLFLVHTPPSSHPFACLFHSIVEPNRWLSLFKYKRFRRWRVGWDGSNVPVLSPDIFECGCSICQILVAASFAAPRRTMILCLHHWDRLCALSFIFWTPEPLLKWEHVGHFFRDLWEEIHSIAVAVTQSLDSKEQRRWAPPFFLWQEWFLYCSLQYNVL